MLQVRAANEVSGFVENDWIGRTVRIGDEVRLSITGPCPRCVMTTLAQVDLPKDSGILRTAAQHNQVNVGVYASVTESGEVRRGEAVTVEWSRLDLVAPQLGGSACAPPRAGPPA